MFLSTCALLHLFSYDNMLFSVVCVRFHRAAIDKLLFTSFVHKLMYFSPDNVKSHETIPYKYI